MTDQLHERIANGFRHSIEIHEKDIAILNRMLAETTPNYGRTAYESVLIDEALELLLGQKHESVIKLTAALIDTLASAEAQANA